MKPTYTVEMKCENCGHEFEKEFKTGHTCAGYHECNKCGCQDAKVQ